MLTIPVLQQTHGQFQHPSAQTLNNHLSFAVWSAFGAASALITGSLALVEYTARKGMASLIISAVLLSAGLYDLYTILACGKLSDTFQTARMYQSWMISRGLHLFLLTFGTTCFILIKKGRNACNSVKTAALVFITCFISTGTAVGLTSISTIFPAEKSATTFVTHPYDLAILALYIVLGVAILPNYNSRFPSFFRQTVILSIIPSALASVFMATHRQEFDQLFNSAYFLRSVSYLVPLLSIAVGYLRANHKEQNFISELRSEMRNRILANQNLKEREMALARTGAELKKNVEELVRSNSELEQFAYVASHDLQEPLRKIQAFGNLLERKYGPLLPQEGKEYTRRMQDASARMQTMIDDLLSLSRTRRNDSLFRGVNLEDSIREVLTDLEYAIEKKKARIIVNANITIRAIPGQMRQLFQNLISNSLKFSKPGITPIITITAKPVIEDEMKDQAGVLPSKDYTCLIEVTDNGIGFEKKDSERIFMLFQKLHSRDEYEGAGLGLALCKKITDNHSGYIEAEGEEGQGALIRIFLPI